MGFNGIDDMISEMTSGKYLRADFMKSLGGIGTVVAGRFYDLSVYPLTASQLNVIHGNMVRNYDFLGGNAYWNSSAGSNWAWTQATHLMTKTAGTTGPLYQYTACSSGVTYSVAYTITRSAGSITPSLAGSTDGTARASSATFRENLICGSSTGFALTFWPSSDFAGTVDLVSVTRDKSFTPYTDINTVSGGDHNLVWHGGNVSTDTKHLTNMGAWVNLAASAPNHLILVDMLGCYPRITTNTSSQMPLDNTLTLPRSTDGAGVMAFMSLGVTNGANAQNMAMSYTNSTGKSGRGLGYVVANTASAIVGHAFHSGVSAGNTGAFLPLGFGDRGIRSVESVTFSTGSASAGTADLILCRPLATLPLTAAFYTNERDFVNQLPSLPRIYDGACLGLLAGAGAVMAASVFQGYLDFTWG